MKFIDTLQSLIIDTYVLFFMFILTFITYFPNNKKLNKEVLKMRPVVTY
jgi:hypothetical protein